jgi:hypothetical protein
MSQRDVPQKACPHTVSMVFERRRSTAQPAHTDFNGPDKSAYFAIPV